MNSEIEAIEAKTYSLAAIFSSDFKYVIPNYQRPYSWTCEQVTDLFNDLYDAYENNKDNKDNHYFLDSIVLVKNENDKKAFIIDGQQRLTSLTILLVVIANQINSNAFRDYIHIKGKPIEKIDAQPRISLREIDAEFFQKYIQNDNLKELFEKDDKHLENDAQRNIKNNSEYFSERLKEDFGDNIEQIEEFASFIITKCYLVCVTTFNED